MFGALFGNKRSSGNQFNGPEWDELRAELQFENGRYWGSQRVVATLTGLHRTTINAGLGLQGVAGYDPEIGSEALQRKGSGVAASGRLTKLQRFIEGQGASPWKLRQEWSEGRISDRYICLLYTSDAADE